VSIVSFKPGKSSTKHMGIYEVKDKLVEAKRKNLELSNEYLELKIKKAKLEITILEKKNPREGRKL
jgi:hypothetical protein